MIKPQIQGKIINDKRMAHMSIAEEWDSGDYVITCCYSEGTITTNDDLIAILKSFVPNLGRGECDESIRTSA